MKHLIYLAILVLISSCYKEGDYDITSDKSADLIEVYISDSIILADSFSTIQLRVYFNEAVDSAKAKTVFRTTGGTFVESNSRSAIVYPYLDLDKNILVTEAKLKSSLKEQNITISVNVNGFILTKDIIFKKSFPDSIELSANTISVMPRNDIKGEVTFITKVYKNVGYPSTNTLVDLVVYDSSFTNEIGSFRINPAVADSKGISSFVYVLGDSIANDINYVGKLFAVSYARISDIPLNVVSDTLVLISSK